MAGAPIQFSHEETVKLINECAKEKGDSFTLRVTQKRPGALVSTVVLAFRGANASHFATPESWLPSIVGGGEYALQAFHNSESSSRIGSPIPLQFSGTPAQRLLIEAIRHPAWPGPGDLIYPSIEAQAAAGQVPTPQAQPNGPQQAQAPQQPQSFGGVQFQTGWGPPQQVVQGPASQGQASTSFAPDAAALIQLETRAREEIARQREALDKDKLKAEFESQLARVKLEMQQAVASRAPEKAGPTMVETLTAVASTLAPFWLEAKKANDAALERQAIRDREAQARADQMAAEQRAMMMAFVEKLSARNDPSKEVLQMLEISKMQSAGHAELMTKTVEAMGVMSKISIGMIETMADTMQGPEQNPMLEAVREMVKAFSTLSSGAKNGTQKMVQAQTRALEAGPQRQVQAPQQVQVPQAQPTPVAHAATNGATAHAQPVPVVEYQKPNAPAPNVPPASELEDGPSAFGHVADSVEQLEQMIRAHTDVEIVARFFFKALETAEMQEALKEHGGIEKLLMTKLGVWMNNLENTAYMATLGQAVNRVGTELGAFEEGESGDSEGEEATE